MSAPTSLILAGAEGNLAISKLYPALYRLHIAGLMPAGLRIFGMGRSGDGDAFVRRVRQAVAGAGGDWKAFAGRLQYARGDATDADFLRRVRQQLPDGEQMVYLATPPSIFAATTAALGEAGLAADARIVVEKPLGDSRARFDQLNSALLRHFAERRIYRIDHYLGKEAVQNLLALRFGNSLFEPLWNHHYIDHVQITAAESDGAGGRWSFYNSVGALRDMVQNHLLQLLCLVSMEAPARDSPDEVRDEKLKVMRCVRMPSREHLGDWSLRAQYGDGQLDGQKVPGYGREQDAGDGASDTETFVALRVAIDNSRWRGVPFYLRTGKRLARRYCEIVVQFKAVAHQIFRLPGDGTQNNMLRIRLQPDEGISLRLLNRVPGLDSQTRLHSLCLNLSRQADAEPAGTADAYDRLLLDAMRGNQTLFVRADEVRAAWDWIDAIRAGWQEAGQPLHSYAAGSWGPPRADAIIAAAGHAWHDSEAE